MRDAITGVIVARTKPGQGVGPGQLSGASGVRLEPTRSARTAEQHGEPPALESGISGQGKAQIRMFQADGVLVVNGRPGVNVTVAFDISRKGQQPGPIGAAARRRAVPPPVQTDKLGRWVQDGFAEGVEYVASVTAPGITFSPARSSFDLDRHHLRTEGTAATFSASGVARTPALLNQPGKPPGIPGVQVSFLRIAGRADLPLPPPVTTAPDGTWSQQGFQVGSSYRAVPSRTGLAFTPPAVDITPVASSEFTGSVSVFTIGGRIQTAGGAVEPGVTIGFTRIAGAGAVPDVVVTDGAGTFHQTGFDRSSQYRVTPTKAPERFDPTSREVIFAPNAFPTFITTFQRRTNLIVNGQVLTTAGAGLLSTVIRFDRLSGSGAVPLPITTGSNGEYRAEGLDTGTRYRVTGTRPGFGVTPAVLQTNTPGTFTLNLTAFPSFGVAGTVLDTGGAIPVDFASLIAFAGSLPPVQGAVVAFHPTDRTNPGPDPVTTGPEGTFGQSGFEVGGTFLVEASAPGYTGAILTPLFSFGLGGPFSAPNGNGGSVTIQHTTMDPVVGLLLLLQRT